MKCHADYELVFQVNDVTKECEISRDVNVKVKGADDSNGAENRDGC